MAINNLSGTSIPAHVVNPAEIAGTVDPAPSGAGTSTYSIIVECAQHHAPGAVGFPVLAAGSGVNIPISYLDANSLKHAMNSLSKNWSVPGGAENIFTNAATFNAATGNKFFLNEWKQLTSILDSLNTGGLSGSNASPIDNNTTLSLSFHNELVGLYNNYIAQCLCNSDCQCNSVCSCNADCGCNYSDKRLKTNILYLYYEMIDGKKVNIYSYNYKENDLGLPIDQLFIGVIAQDLIDNNLEQFVNKRLDDTYYQVNYKELNNNLDRKLDKWQIITQE